MTGDDWRSALLERIRALITQALPASVEEAKWKRPGNPGGVPTWSLNGIICTGEIYKDKVKLTFAQGARIADPDGLFNSSLDGKVRRAIDIGPNDPVDDAALMALFRRAAALNGAG
ncbi:MAG: DUF1801 domain-containing protein [Proteobacteria bacterium]|nr:DUF1801 domain-containing protein [Pseudomonadota bacterium]